MSKTTSRLIADLSRGLAPRMPADSAGQFLMKCIGAFTLVLTFWLMLLPLRQNILPEMQRPFFLLESVLWLGISITAAFVVYGNRIPGLRTRVPQIAAGSLIAILFIAIAAQSFATDPLLELSGEASLSRGRCGFLIMSIAISSGLAFFWWARRGAVTSLLTTGVWIAISAGSLAAFTMQLVCEYENGLHLLLWHVVPVVVLTLAGGAAGRRFLKW